MENIKKEKIIINIVRGSDGLSLQIINNEGSGERISGPKAWGNPYNKPLKSLEVEAEKILNILETVPKKEKTVQLIFYLCEDLDTLNLELEIKSKDTSNYIIKCKSCKKVIVKKFEVEIELLKKSIIEYKF